MIKENVIMVTGGAGFIGINLVKYLLECDTNVVINVDKLTYASNKSALHDIQKLPNYYFYEADICDTDLILKILKKHSVNWVFNLAAESHVDRSIDNPKSFVDTNILGTFSMLEAFRKYLDGKSNESLSRYRYLQVSTDEVYGDLVNVDEKSNSGLKSYFVETSPYAPSSPYSASKASADHLVQAWFRTYGLPVLITNCSNNYGPFQNKEKLIPNIISSALAGRSIPIYGNGMQIRDWLFVEDHVKAQVKVMEYGVLGNTYNIGGSNETANLDLARSVCRLMDQMRPSNDLYEKQISFVKDRPGHDRRYAIDHSKITQELGWSPTESLTTGLYKTVEHYLTNQLITK